MKHIENTSTYKAEEGCFIVRKADGFIMGESIDLGSADSIDNYEDKEYTKEEYKEFCEEYGIKYEEADKKVVKAKIMHYPIIHTSDDIELPTISDNSNVGIVTTFSDREKAILVNQLEENNIGYINAADGVENFIKAYKPVYYYNVLKGVKTEYVLIIDSYDSVINRLKGIEDLLEPYGKNVIYGAWHFHFPASIDVDFGVPEDNELKYLNSGTLFGKTKDVKAFYKALSEYIEANYNTDDSQFKNMEQYWIHKFLSENPNWVSKVGIDYNEDIVKNNNIK